MPLPLSTVLKVPVLLACLGLAVLPAQARQALTPFKDELFSKQQLLGSEAGGAFEVVGYDEMRDINGRDQIPEKRVKQDYVSLAVRKQQVDESLTLDGGRLDVTRAGPATGAAFTVVFIHGRDGDRRLGANDYSFGGNFNRLKNLVVGNGGTYYAPSVRRFDSEGVAAVAALVRHAAQASGGRPVILACASMGSQICWGLSRDPSAVPLLGGMVVLSGMADPDFLRSPYVKSGKPIWFAHGSRDPVYAAADQKALFDRLLKARIPVHFTLYDTGNHGTPIRMIDWRKALNFSLDR